ncbi:hypothetical protein PYW08_006015 [Mythimna loreyi]|uniref:Uncharacterized protein n=1 Tax=Mythimna loreyi TaxID=667449 RepID=A0ACC2QLG2_9NEOP|nr:hypothetical protein PYW08_006015 [Mythimna loreyi]
MVTRRLDGEPPIARHPQARAYGGRKSGSESRRRLGRERRCLKRSASSFASITASQKEATACHSSSLRTMASTKARRERSPPPIAPTRTRRCSAQAGHTSTVCSIPIQGYFATTIQIFRNDLVSITLSINEIKKK